MGKDKLIPIFAMIVLLIGISSALYVHATQVNKDTITFNGEEYTIDEIFILSETITIDTDDGEKTGASLDDFVKKTSNKCASCSMYTIKAGDGYQKTIEYDILKTGIITKNRRVFFPDTAHALWVSDVIEIEVK